MDVLIEMVKDLSRTVCIWSAIVLVLALGLRIIKNRMHAPHKKKKGGIAYRLDEGRVEGIYYGKRCNLLHSYSPADKEGHALVLGGSGLGKTMAILLQTIRHWLGGLFVIDVSGDIHKNINTVNKLVYAPEEDDETIYNIFAPVDEADTREEKMQCLLELANQLMPIAKKFTSDAGEYFAKGGRRILTAALITGYFLGMDFIDIVMKIKTNSPQELFSWFAKGKIPEAKMHYSSFYGVSEKNVAGAKEACDDAIEFFAVYPSASRSIRRPCCGEVAFSPSMVENHQVFVVIPHQKLELYAPLVRVMVAQCLQYFYSRPVLKRKQILLALDEFSSFGNIDGFIPGLRKLRKNRVRVMILTQALSDLDLEYGRDGRRSIFENFAHVVLLRVKDPDDQEFFARVIGKKTVKKKTITKNAQGISETITEVKEWAVPPEELGNLGENLIVCYDGGHQKLKKKYYFKHKH